MGLVSSLNRPGGNMTGFSFLATAVVAKLLEVLRETAPDAAVTAVLVNPANPQSGAYVMEAREAARVLGLRLFVIEAGTEAEIDSAFATLVQRKAGALLLAGDTFFHSRFEQLAMLAARHAIPAISQDLDFPSAGGLMSYGASIADADREVGAYAGRILRGAKPADLPVQLSMRVKLILNLKTAKALGLTIPLPLLARADEVIE